MRTLTLTVEPQFENCPIKDVLSKRLWVSDALLSRLKRRSGSLLLNGEPVYVTRRVHAGDRVTVSVGDVGKDPRIRPMPMPLSVLYEDEDLLVIDKPAGLSVHPARDPDEITLENALAAYLGADENPHPVSRLDRGTTGLLTVAKSGWAHAWMKQVQHSGQMQKVYLAITRNMPDPPVGSVSAPIGFYEGSGYQRCVRPDGAPAESDYQVLRQNGGFALIRLVPKTGRTHQLRVHMAHIGCPLLGDWLYGSRDPSIDRPALHAAELSFYHPLQNMTVTLHSPLPEDMRRFFPDPSGDPS